MNKFIMGLMLFLVLCILVIFHFTAAAVNIVDSGSPNARIVVADSPPRMTALAARELQTYLQKISGVELPIVNRPVDGLVNIYVGRSEYTDRLGVTDAGLQYGAFRMQSGPDWLVLLGDDFDFAPREPWARKHNDRERVQKEWEAISGGQSRNPMISLHRRYHRGLGLWIHDRGGSLNAVYEFLRTLGVRWYMPGDLGEVVPQLSSIELPAIDRTVRPDFPVRYWHGAFMAFDNDTLLWDLRLGMNSGYEKLGAGMHVHGMRLVMRNPALFKEHPDYFALDRGKRNPHHACFSSEGLLRETVKFARAVFDHYDDPMVSVWPNDGFRQCQCDQCRDIPTSDYVWGFVDRVAREVYKTHPDKLISGGAYSSYRQAPENIEKFSPNVLVFVAAHRPGLDHPERWEYQWNLIDGWRRRTEPGQLLRNSNNYYDLVIHTRGFDRELKALKGISLGDWNEVRRGSPARGEPVAWRTPGKDHLNQYVNARLLWDADLDLDALLEEYYTMFFGPARDEMKAAVEYAENNYTRPGKARFIAWKDRIRYVELLHAALAKAGDSVYGRRIQLMIDEIQPLERMRTAEALEKLRGDTPEYSGAINMANNKWQASRDTFVLDGKADEPFWTVYSGGRGMNDALTGKKTAYRTGFRARWYQNKLYFVIHCADEAGAPVNIASTEDGDPAMLDGDHVEILLETDVNSYYRIVVNPAGALLDMDMAEEGAGASWSSEAEVAAHVGEAGWSVEVCIPVLGEEEGMLDPLHNVVGRLPTRTWPWHFNVGRVRVRGETREVWAFVPTGSESLQDRSKFARFATR